jgi:hypothetical protein
MVWARESRTYKIWYTGTALTGRLGSCQMTILRSNSLKRFSLAQNWRPPLRVEVDAELRRRLRRPAPPWKGATVLRS